MEKNQEFEVRIIDMNEDGAGVGKVSDACSLIERKGTDRRETEENADGRGGFAWFIKDAVPGDRILAAATKVKKSYGFARLVKVLEPSPDRVQPACENARACGGCQLQSIRYEAQLAFKENRVRSVLERIGGFGREVFSEDRGLFSDAGLSAEVTVPDDENSFAEFEKIIGMEEPWRYRNKAQYPVSSDKYGGVIAGFYAGHTHSVIRCEDCRIGQAADKKILETVTRWMEKEHIAPYNEETGKGIVRHILIRTSRTTGEIMVCPVINADDLPYKKELADLLKDCGVTAFSLSVNKKNTNVILGDKTVCVYGDGFITDHIGGISFHISPQSFFQVNPVQVEKLYGKALEYAALTGNETVWDLYCGVGTISLFMARHAKKVYGVEIVPQAIEDAKQNAERNGLTNTEFFVGKAEEVVPVWMEEGKKGETGNGAGADKSHPDVICVDPPRKGCDEKCLETILKAAPQRIVYVSCDPATLARDCRYLCDGGYELKKVCPVDMFPQTVHVETVCLLSKLSEVKHHVEVELNEDEIGLTSAEGKATYDEIREYVMAQTGLHVTNLNIAQIKRKYGIIERENYNLPKSKKSRQLQCPLEKEKAIKTALEYFQMI